MFGKKDVLFCNINPTCYKISMQKEILKRHIKNLKSSEKIAKVKAKENLGNLVYSQSGTIIKKGPGINPLHQENKAVNIKIASDKINKLLIRPGETFSFWQTVGKSSKRNGFKEGRVIINNKLTAGTGGGLCNLANTIHLLVLHSPLAVTEFHSHSDALAPDHGVRVPLSAGTSVCYNHIDFRFKNTTDQSVELLTWCEDGKLCGELRSEREFPYTYKITEEGHRFQKEGDTYYRVSKIYKETYDRDAGTLLDKTLILDNHSKVMFDYALIPEEYKCGGN